MTKQARADWENERGMQSTEARWARNWADDLLAERDRLAAQVAEAGALLAEAGGVHLADETTIRQLERMVAAGLERAAQAEEMRCLSYSLRKMDPAKPSRMHRCGVCDLAAAIRALSAPAQGETP